MAALDDFLRNSAMFLISRKQQTRYRSSIFLGLPFGPKTDAGSYHIRALAANHPGLEFCMVAHPLSHDPGAAMVRAYSTLTACSKLRRGPRGKVESGSP